MAIMFPSGADSFATSGEEAVYRFLEGAGRKDPEFLAWHSPDIGGREPDFIIYAPECGLVVLEVKDWVAGQIVEADPKRAILRIGGRLESRKQPLAQAREYVNALMALFGRRSPADGGAKQKLPCPIAWGAALPHISRAGFHAARLGEVMDAEKILFWDELHEFSPLARDASGRKLRQWLAERFSPRFPFSLDGPGLLELKRAIFPSIRVELPARGGESGAQAQRIMTLDQEQENLAMLMGGGRHLIPGPSGSGKTLILTRLAWRLAKKSGAGRGALVVCFNFALVGYIRRLLAGLGARLGPGGVEVAPFYGLCERILGERLAHSAETGDYYELVVQETLERLGGSGLKGAWDAVLVDEGQDFSENMARVVLGLLPEHGTLAVAVDENQSLYQLSSPWERLARPRLWRLSRQYRNTRQIAGLACRVLGIPAPELMGADGPEPEIIAEADPGARVAACADAAAQLVQAGCPMSQIAILCAKSREPGMESLPEALASALEARGLLARWASRDTASKSHYDITTDSVTISTIHSAKGLDYARVFLFGLDHLDPDDPRARKLAHVGITRAREGLALVAKSRGALDGLLNGPCQPVPEKL